MHLGEGLSRWLFSALAFAVSTSAMPGPNNAMVASSGATFGFARTVPHLAGVAAGFSVMIVAVALGAGDLMRAAPRLHDALRWIGAAYLILLALKIATAHPAVGEGARTRRKRPLTFLQAALFQWLNPKAWIIALGGVATYTTSGHVVAQASMLAVIFLVGDSADPYILDLDGRGYRAAVAQQPRAARLQSGDGGPADRLAAALAPRVMAASLKLPDAKRDGGPGGQEKDRVHVGGATGSAVLAAVIAYKTTGSLSVLRARAMPLA